jgi:CO/xanthine dehydrogenase FAD-binding subunit
MWYERLAFYSPQTLSEALQLRRQLPEALLLAGGTDLLVQLREPDYRFNALIDLSQIVEISAITKTNNWLRIGAGVTFTRYLREATDYFPPLIEAVSQLASPAIRNRATFGGNIVNASPAADTLPPLYAVDAYVLLQSQDKERRIPIADFITGPKRTILGTDEILTAIEFELPTNYQYYYRKVGTRRALALSKVSFCGFYFPEKHAVRLTYGAVAPTVIRARAAEAAFSQGIGYEQVVEIVGKSIQPIDDQRSTARYRRFVCEQLTRAFLNRI